jgi:NADH-quinone oxidoreductase subunit M
MVITDHILSWIVFVPLAGALVLLLWQNASQKQTRLFALLMSAIEFVLTLVLVFQFEATTNASSYIDQFQLVEKLRWFGLELGAIGSFEVYYHLGVDGLSLWLVVLSGLIMVIGVLSSWHYDHQYRGYFILYLLLSASIFGCFLALDLFLFYLFFELMLLPMFFLIGIWGGPNRAYASIKFFIYTLVGSLLILMVMIGLFMSATDPVQLSGGNLVHTFDILYLSDASNYVEGGILSPDSSVLLFGKGIRYVAFLALMIGFAIKLPSVPVHTWLPDAHVEAPTAISVILAALLLKVGGYGMMRVAYAIFPQEAVSYSVLIATIGVISILYGGLNAMAQRDLKRLVAYSSVSHMGFVMVGLASLSIDGATGVVFHMLSHGLIAAGLFLIVGVIYDRTHDRQIENYSGLANRMPAYAFVTIVLFFASLGLPGLSGFVGELLILMGAFGASINGTFSVALAILATSGIIISAVYYLWTTQRVFFGVYWVREEGWDKSMKDLGRREWVMFLPLIILILLLGIYPRLVLDPMNESVRLFVEHILNR